MQSATHHDGAGKSIVVIPRGVSVGRHMDVIKDICCNQTDVSSVCRQVIITALSFFCHLFGFRGRPSLDTLRGIAAELLKSEGGALIKVPPVPAARGLDEVRGHLLLLLVGRKGNFNS